MALLPLLALAHASVILKVSVVLSPSYLPPRSDNGAPLTQKLSCVQTANYTLDPFAALPAKFGSRLSFQGVEGDLVVRPWHSLALQKTGLASNECYEPLQAVLLHKLICFHGKVHADTAVLMIMQAAEPADACSDIRRPDSSLSPWIAVISRSRGMGPGCNFATKVGLVGLCFMHGKAQYSINSWLPHRTACRLIWLHYNRSNTA